MEPWFRNTWHGYWPINRYGWLFNGALFVGGAAFFLVCLYLTSLNTLLALPLIPLFAFGAFKANAIIDNRTRKD